MELYGLSTPLPNMVYTGVFENELGIQSTFLFDYATKQGTLIRDEDGQINSYLVVGGTVPGLDMNVREQLWLRACWSTAKRREEHWKRKQATPAYTPIALNESPARQERLEQTNRCSVIRRSTRFARGFPHGTRWQAWRAAQHGTSGKR